MNLTRPQPALSRRTLLKLGSLLFDPLAPWPVKAGNSGKQVLVAGAGLAGLSCAWELTKRGHDVTVLEASNRTGGHVRTLTTGFPDNLYADCGAEHFTKPGYDLCYRYAEELGLTLLPYPHRDNQLVVWENGMLQQKEATRLQLAAAKLNDRERKFLQKGAGATLSDLYLNKYATHIENEYQPFGCGLDWLDDLSLTDLLKRDGASEGAIADIGSTSSALHVIWKRRIVQLRGIPEEPTKFFRVKGGNQGLPNALAARLGSRISKNTAVTAIRWDNAGVVVTVRKNGQTTKMNADYLVCCMNAAMLRQIPATPAWPNEKQWAIANVPYTVETRPIFQSRSKFWKQDGFSGNMEFGSPILGPLWPTATEVQTDRGIMIGTGQASVTSEAALKVFHRYYPGPSADFEKTLVVDWSRDPWAMGCEARDYKPGELHKFWPAVIAPAGRVHFAGAYCDNQSWGMEAATRSGFRVARTIHEGLSA